ncbi:MAG TPA: trigger factor [Hyphomicrobiaceae bacterium]|nr:trigger factor [Hyphomicrobiaceae bacterium]
MQVTETSSDGLKRTLKVVVGASELADRFTTRLDEVKDTIQLRGFRKGKVPVGHIKKVYGRSLMAEVLQDLVEKSSQKALEDRQERPAVQPEIAFSENKDELEQVMDGKADLAYTMSFEVLPKIDLVDFSTLKLEREVVEVDEETIDKAIADLAERNVTFEVEEGRVAAEGDQLKIDFVGSIDGTPFDGGTGEDVEIVLGRGGFIPGFEDGLKGAKAGDDVTIKATFPAEYQVPDLAGKEASFATKVKSVAKPVKPEINEEFAKGFGLDSLEALRKVMRERIEGEYAEFSRTKIKRALLDALDKAHEFALPEALVQQEFDQIWSQVTNTLQQSGKTFEDEGKTEESARAEYRTLAERRVRLGLVLAEIGTKAKVEVTQEELRNALFREARRFPGQERMVYEYFEKTPGAVQQLRAPIYEDKVVDHILGEAKPTEKKVSREELLKMPDDGEAAVPGAPAA